MTALASLATELRAASLPPERRGIERDGVRLLVTDRERRTHAHARFVDLARFVREGDLFVVNDSATLPAALRARRAGGSPLVLHVAGEIDARLWTAEPLGNVRAGEELALPGGARAVAIAPVESSPRLWYVRFAIASPMHAYLAEHGEPIRYEHVRERLPLTDYQTIFARRPGSAEMPSAARPFTPRLVRALRAAGARFATITLHCGVSSFEVPERPAPERYAVSPHTARAVNETRARGGRIVAVGSTAVRALETARAGAGAIAARGWTDLVIGPSCRPALVDALITGFHDPQATHVSMLRAFLDERLLGGAYAEAAAGGYYAHEFGDAHAIV